MLVSGLSCPSNLTVLDLYSFESAQSRVLLISHQFSVFMQKSLLIYELGPLHVLEYHPFGLRLLQL